MDRNRNGIGRRDEQHNKGILLKRKRKQVDQNNSDAKSDKETYKQRQHQAGK
jgi:hypothetical protein